VRARAELTHSHGPLEPGLLTYVASLRLAYGANADQEQAAQVSGERYNSSSVSSQPPPPPKYHQLSSSETLARPRAPRGRPFRFIFAFLVVSLCAPTRPRLIVIGPISQTPVIGSEDETDDSLGAVQEATEAGSLSGQDSAGNGGTDGDMAEECVVFHIYPLPARMNAIGGNVMAPTRRRCRDHPKVCIRFSRSLPCGCAFIYPTPFCRRKPADS
jgi:hypothetical protein